MPNPSPERGILFVSHLATRNGAPIMLLHFLRWLRENGERPFSILVDDGTGGALLAEYAKVADTWAADTSRWCPGGLRSQVLTAVGLGSWAKRAEKANVQRFALRDSPVLIYANSIAAPSARLIEMLNPSIPVLTHVHELEHLLRVQAGEGLTATLARTRQFIACSDAVKRNLVSAHNVAPERIETIHECIPVSQTQAGRTREQVFQELGLPHDATLVMAGGGADWRKGSDLFIQLARVVCRQRPNVYFAWIGGGLVHELEHDARSVGLTPKMRFTGEVAKTIDYFAAADVFVLTSREDPYPLVCLEAAAVGKPIVCFAEAGGMPEFVEDDCGFVVPYLNTEAMADRVIRLLDCPRCREKMGAAARRKVAERHDVSVAAPRIMEIIERTIQDAGC